MVEIPIDRVLTEELEADVILGGPTIDEGGFHAQAADQPIGLRIRSIFERLCAAVPPQMESLNKMFELWVVPHRVSIIRRSGHAEPSSVGIEVEYQNEGRTCSIISLLPSAEFLEHARLTVSGGLSASGELVPLPALPSALLSEIGLGSLKFGASSEVGMKYCFTASVATPRISAVGIGSSRCEWRFDRADRPLFGRDIETWAVVALPKRQKSLAYRLRFYLVTRMFIVPTRRESDWLELRCDLPK
jgi:hypothetical protein